MVVLWRYAIMDVTLKKTDKMKPLSVAADPRWARGSCTRQDGGRRVLVFGCDDRRLLPAFMSFAHR